MAVAFDALSESHTGTTGSTSEASFSWSHDPAGTPKGVIVFVYTISATPLVSSVTYDGTAVPAIVGGEAICTDGDEDGVVTAFFLGSSVPVTDPATIVVNRTNDATVMYAIAYTVTALTNTEVNTAGIVLEQAVGTLAEVNVDDGSPGTSSVRFSGHNHGHPGVLAAGANSTTNASTRIDLGARCCQAVYETVAGQGSRPVGINSVGGSDDRASVYLAVREAVSVVSTGALLLLGVGT